MKSVTKETLEPKDNLKYQNMTNRGSLAILLTTCFIYETCQQIL